MHPNLLHLGRSCAKWRNGVLLVAVLALSTFGWSPSRSAPGAITTLQVVAVTDTSLVLTWTEVTSGNATIARYAVRLSPAPLTWAASADVLTGSCAAPIVGATAAGGRLRSCVVGGLQPNLSYAVQAIAYTGVLNSTAVFGALSNVATATTAERVGPLLLTRPRMFLDTLGPVRSVQIGQIGTWRWPLDIGLLTGDYPVTFRNAADSAVAHGYLLIVKP